MHEYHSSPAREYKIEVKDRDMNQILVIGSLNMDVVVRMERLPALGETVLGEEYWNNPGGKGANQAYAARLAGGQVAMLGSVGTDKYGVRMLELLEKAGVQVMDIQRDSGQSTGTAFVLTGTDGSNSIVVVPGANSTCSSEYLAENAELFSKAACVLLQLEIPLESVCSAIRQAKTLGKLVILNPAPARQDIPEDLFPLLDVITPNETELSVLTGGPAGTVEEIEQSAKLLLYKGVRNVVVTLGARGSLIVNQNGALLVPARKVSAVDTTGAGDCFNGVLAVALSAGMPLEKAVLRANLAASISVTRSGALTSMPTLEDLESLWQMFSRDDMSYVAEG